MSEMRRYLSQTFLEREREINQTFPIFDELLMMTVNFVILRGGYSIDTRISILIQFVQEN